MASHGRCYQAPSRYPAILYRLHESSQRRRTCRFHKNTLHTSDQSISLQNLIIANFIYKSTRLTGRIHR